MENGQTLTLGDDLTINPSQLMALYLNKRYRDLSEYFLAVFTYFQKKSFSEHTPAFLSFVNLFVENFLFFFTRPEFQIETDYAPRFIRCNSIIANLVSISEFATTDVHLRILTKRKDHLAKILSLYSARNQLRIAPKSLFDADPQLTSVWYIHFYDLYTTGLASADSFQRFQEHLRYLDPRLDCSEPINRLYFGSTYIDGENDKHLKRHLNTIIRKKNNITISFDESYQNNKIAVFSACWRSSHAVYKNQYRYLQALRNDYELTFFPLRENQDSDLFDHVETSCLRDTLNVEPVVRNKFRMIYFPDIGMSQQSIVLANTRLAPIQMCCFGHSVSTHGAEIDYFVLGEKVEDLRRYKENYSERLVVLPGLGIIHKPPEYQPQYPKKTDSRLIINCSCSAQKCNHRLLTILSTVLEKSSVPVLFRIFVGTGALRDNGFFPFLNDLHDLLGSEHVEIITHKPYSEYMLLMEEGDFAIDSFHFGGCNTIVDAVYLGKPIVAWQGSKWYNRIGPQQLSAIGLGELVANSEQEYLGLILRLIHDQAYRVSLYDKIKKINFLETELFSPQSSKYFKDAIDYLMKNHEALQAEGSQDPILIGG